MLLKRLELKKKMQFKIASRFVTMRRIQLCNREIEIYKRHDVEKIVSLVYNKFELQRKMKTYYKEFKMLQINYDVLLNDDDFRKNGFKDYIMHRSTIMNELKEKTKTIRNNICTMT